jgi:RNA polymerase primary sigma factor
MSVLPLRVRGGSRAGPSSGRIPGPSLAIVNRDGTVDRPASYRDQPADTTRAAALLATRIEYVAHPSFDDPGARDAILAPMPAPGLAQARRRTKAAAGLPPYLASLYLEGPLLSREQEAHLFRKMNYLKARARRLRDRIAPACATAADLDEIERLLDEALAAKTQIVSANLRLVVAIAKQHLGPRDDLFERVSDGNYALLRAIEVFDYSRGNKFSTYATRAIHNQFTRAFRGKNHRQPQSLLGHDEDFMSAADPRTDDLEQSDFQDRQEAIGRLLAGLDDRERRILVGRYGIGGACEQTLKQIGKELGISKERVRQIELRAADKLRKPARMESPDLLLA